MSRFKIDICRGPYPITIARRGTTVFLARDTTKEIGKQTRDTLDKDGGIRIKRTERELSKSIRVASSIYYMTQ